MKGWRSRFVFLLVVYFAGFATAIYCLAPVPEDQASEPREQGFAYSVLKSDEFAMSFNAGMHKCLDFAGRASRYVKQKLNDSQP